MVTVSVALCTHNGSRFVEEQVRSILDQSRPVDEIVLSDDASQDATVALVRAAVAAHPAPPVLVVRENFAALGVTANFEAALRAASGELIALCDQDDSWHPDRIRLALAAFEARPSLELLFGDARLVDAAGSDLGQTLFGVLGIGHRELEVFATGGGFELLLRRNLATGATMMVRSSLVARAVPLPLEWVHDEWLAILAASTGSAGILTTQLIDYRQHSANQIGVRKATLASKLRKVLGAHEQRGLATRSALLASALRRAGSPLAELAAEKAAFERAREVLPRSRWRRISAIRALDAQGCYARFASQGRSDTMRDLLQSRPSV